MTALEHYQDRTPTLPGQPPEVAYLDPTGGRLVAWAQAARAAHALAESLCKTSFVPKDFRGKPEEATAAILLGDELGMKPLAALASVYVVHGKPSIYAKTMVALVQSHGHEVWTESSTDNEVIVEGRRRGSNKVETAKWDIKRARTAGYTSNAKYQTNPQEMLWAKAAAEVCKKIASDVLAGVPLTVEDLELEQPEPTQTVARSAPAKRVQRAARPTAPEPEFDEPTAPQEPVKATAERVEPGITDQQSKKLHALLREAGIADRDAGLAYIGDIIQREIGSTKELTKAEASRAIDQIETEKEPAEPQLPEGAGPVPAWGGAE